MLKSEFNFALIDAVNGSLLWSWAAFYGLGLRVVAKQSRVKTNDASASEMSTHVVKKNHLSRRCPPTRRMITAM
eukprot:3459809-Pleurochrysis_carterae.AAC.1